MEGKVRLVQDKATGQYELEPAAAMGCKYHDFTRHDVFSCFHKRSDNAAVVMIGAQPGTTWQAWCCSCCQRIPQVAAVHGSWHNSK